MREYTILDEPRPGPLGNLVVSPLWPFLALMLCSSLLGWAWFLFNGIAMGSPSKGKEWGLVAAGVAGTAALGFGGYHLIEGGMLAAERAPYVGIAITVWRVGVGYWLHHVQSRTFEIHEYYGGVVRTGLPVVVVGFLIMWRFDIPEDPWGYIVYWMLR
jgi:hypothetical protein